MDTTDTSAAIAQDGILSITRDIVTAYLCRNPIPTDRVPDLIATVYASVASAVSGVVKEAVVETKRATPAEITRSITPDALVSFLDGKSYKSMKRHLRTHGLTPDAYREKYGLPGSYPMVATNYAKARSDLAKAMGLGQIRRAPEAAPEFAQAA